MAGAWFSLGADERSSDPDGRGSGSGRGELVDVEEKALAVGDTSWPEGIRLIAFDGGCGGNTFGTECVGRCAPMNGPGDGVGCGGGIVPLLGGCGRPRGDGSGRLAECGVPI